MTDTPIEVYVSTLNVFVNGHRVDPAMYTVEEGRVIFNKPISEIFPELETNIGADGKPEYWVACEHIYVRQGEHD